MCRTLAEQTAEQQSVPCESRPSISWDPMTRVVEGEGGGHGAGEGGGAVGAGLVEVRLHRGPVVRDCLWGGGRGSWGLVVGGEVRQPLRREDAAKERTHGCGSNMAEGQLPHAPPKVVPHEPGEIGSGYCKFHKKKRSFCDSSQPRPPPHETRSTKSTPLLHLPPPTPHTSTHWWGPKRQPKGHRDKPPSIGTWTGGGGGGRGEGGGPGVR